MTVSQVKAILADINSDYSFNSDEFYTLEEFSSICSITDECFYPGYDTRFKLVSKSDIELIEVYRGKVNDAGEFIQHGIYPEYYIGLDQIAGFTLNSQAHRAMPYSVGIAL